MSPEKTVIKNKVKEVASKKGLDRTSFIGVCLSSPVRIEGRRLSADTAGRAYDGETTLSLITASLVAAALKVDLSELFDIQ